MTTLNPIWRTRLWVGAAAIVAVFLGASVAQGSLLLGVVIVAGTVALVSARYQPLPLQLILLAGLLAGYVIGNRGFAQFMPVPGVPLLPAEAALLAVVSVQVFNRAVRGPGPHGLGALDWMIGWWIAVGVVRMVFDGRTYGFTAARDFATVYYAVFFYLAQALVRGQPGSAAILTKTLRISAPLMLVLYEISESFPGLFMDTLALRGVPLIYYKDDLVGAFLAVGAILHYLEYERRGGSWLRLALVLALAAGIVDTNNRAAMLSLAVGAGWLLIGGRWRFAAWLAGAGTLAAMAILMVTQIRNESWHDTPLQGVYERVVSLADPFGQGVYRGEMTAEKGDNNLFRMTWWGLVIEETTEKNPVAGLGFGYDLANEFLREYYAVNPDDFSARSPHSIMLTVFARMGLLGLVPFLGVVALMATRTWRALRESEAAVPFWLATWIIFTSACFGVVLEGPMGAVVFWIMLGAGQAVLRQETDDDTETATPPQPTVPPAAPVNPWHLGPRTTNQ